MTSKLNKRSRAYRAGYAEGLAWDLDGFESRVDVRNRRDGWDEATINGVGSTQCAEEWGVATSGAAWDRACAEYNAGAHSGACVSQAYRTGAAPRDAK